MTILVGGTIFHADFLNFVSLISDHIPFDIILPNLNELRKLDLTYDVKSISTNFYLGCSTISQNDIKNLTAGLEKCYELRDFRLSGTKLEPYMLKLLARALEKGCPHLESIQLPHCRCGDVGLLAFLDSLNFESFPHLKEVVLTNNFLCAYFDDRTCYQIKQILVNFQLKKEPSNYLKQSNHIKLKS